MILTEKEIEERIGDGKIVIDPYSPDQLNPNSYNLTLHDEFLMYDEVLLDARRENRYHFEKLPESGFVLVPGTLYLGRTVERTHTVEGLVPMIEGRSSIARLGIQIHLAAGFGDTGFDGTWTLELSAVQRVRIYAGLEICQIFWIETKGICNTTYKGKYQGEARILPSLLYKELQNGGKKCLSPEMWGESGEDEVLSDESEDE